MAAARKTSAASYLPEDRDLDSLEAAANVCRGCSLYENASQTVFGHGDSHAQLMLIGEQPGDREDVEACRSWVRPADCLPGRSTRRASTPV
ncbi:family 4 uracil-DNA glycosylase [Mycobacterium xenopi 3993]|nr:family 4 uracil-DNA glycosylase [Mycobacterium xenopi 3993]